jgi:acyl-CoA thioesterase FadM
VTYLAEVRVLETLEVATQILALDAKRVHLFHRLMRRDGVVAATAEQLYLHVNTRASKVEPMGDAPYRALETLRAQHAHLSAPPAEDLRIRWRASSVNSDR